MSRTTIFDQPKPVKHGECGNARIDYKPRVLRATTRTWDPEKPLKHAGLALGYSMLLHRYFLSDESAHTCLVAPPGAGKTTRIFVPTLYAIFKSCDSAVVFDNKGELYDLTGADARRSGHKVIVIDYVNWRRSQLFNTLTSVTQVYEEHIAEYKALLEKAAKCKEEDPEAYRDYMRQARNARVDAYEQATSMAQNVASAIAPDTAKTDGFWTPSARDLLTALILLVCTYSAEDWVGKGPAPSTPERRQRTLHSVLALLDQYGQEYTVTTKGKTESKIALQDLFDGIDRDHPASRMFSQARNSKGQTLSSIISSVTQYLNTLVTETNNMISYDTEIDLEKIGDEPTIIYLIASTDQPSKKIMVPIVTMLIYQACVRSAKRHGGCMPCFVHFLMEELGSYDSMPNLSNMVGTGRGYGIRVHAVLQDEAQWLPLFGREQAAVMQNIFNDTVYLNINDGDCARKVSEAIGDYTISVSDGKGGYTQKGVPVVPAPTLKAWETEWGSFVKRSKNTVEGRVRKALYRRHGVWWAMYPSAPVRWQPANIAMGIDSKEKAAAKSRLAEAEDRSAERVIITPWRALALTDEQKTELLESFELGGVDAHTKGDIEKLTLELALDARANGAGGFIGWDALTIALAKEQAEKDFAKTPWVPAEKALELYLHDMREQRKTETERARRVITGQVADAWTAVWKDARAAAEAKGALDDFTMEERYVEDASLIEERSKIRKQFLETYVRELTQLCQLSVPLKTA